jgi:hypothetical protein
VIIENKTFKLENRIKARRPHLERKCVLQTKISMIAKKMINISVDIITRKIIIVVKFENN